MVSGAAAAFKTGEPSIVAFDVADTLKAYHGGTAFENRNHRRISLTAGANDRGNQAVARATDSVSRQVRRL